MTKYCTVRTKRTEHFFQHILRHNVSLDFIHEFNGSDLYGNISCRILFSNKMFILSTYFHRKIHIVKFDILEKSHKLCSKEKVL
jgi:hypothetical protein